jgi:hypothetical protein
MGNQKPQFVMDLEAMVWKMVLDIATGQKDAVFVIQECTDSPLFSQLIPDGSDACAWFSPGKRDRISMYSIDSILRLAPDPIGHRVIAEPHNSGAPPAQPARHAPNLDAAMDDSSRDDPMHDDTHDVEMDELESKTDHAHRRTDQFQRDSAGIDDEQRSRSGPYDDKAKSNAREDEESRSGKDDDEEKSNAGDDEESSSAKDEDEEQSAFGKHDDHPGESHISEGRDEEDSEQVDIDMLPSPTEEHLSRDDDVGETASVLDNEELGDYDPADDDDDDRSEVADLSITTEPSPFKGKTNLARRPGGGRKIPTPTAPLSLEAVKEERKFVPARFMTPIDVDMLVRTYIYSSSHPVEKIITERKAIR